LHFKCFCVVYYAYYRYYYFNHLDYADFHFSFLSLSPSFSFLLWMANKKNKKRPSDISPQKAKGKKWDKAKKVLKNIGIGALATGGLLGAAAVGNRYYKGSKAQHWLHPGEWPEGLIKLGGGSKLIKLAEQAADLPRQAANYSKPVTNFGDLLTKNSQTQIDKLLAEAQKAQFAHSGAKRAAEIDAFLNSRN
jgi:hypothetical protein